MSNQENSATTTTTLESLSQPIELLNKEINNLRLNQSESDPRKKLTSLLGKILKIKITDQRVIVGCFVCTDRDANVILENSCEYSATFDDDEEPRSMGLTLIPGRHIVSVELMQ